MPWQSTGSVVVETMFVLLIGTLAIVCLIAVLAACVVLWWH
jgi:hypothetical protein